MSKQHIIFLHGWAGSLNSYGAIPELLQADGYVVKELHLGEYTTGDDQLSVDDYTIAIERAVNDPLNGIVKPFDVIIHSTGALVVRNWLSRYHLEDVISPVNKFIMAAPANNGSLLAGWGKKLPWDWGNKILYALELASAYTWKLNWFWMEEQVQVKMNGSDIFHLQGTLNDIDFPGFMERIDNYFDIKIPGFEEIGSDNTVRFCAANLNVKGVKIPVGSRFQPGNVKSINGIPIYVFPNKSHFGAKHGILGSADNKADAVYSTILKILQGTAVPPSTPDFYPSFAMLNIGVIDQLGNPHEDFIARFYFGSPAEAQQINIIHRYENNETDCYYLQIGDLGKVSQFGFKIEKNTIRNAVYEESENIDLFFPASNIHFLEVGKTHLIEVVINKSILPAALDFKFPGE